MTDASPITATVDLKAPGRNCGYLLLPHSVHRSAYGHLHVPVATFVGQQDGPSTLLMAGNHGDEYEGQVVLAEMIRTLDPATIRGRLTLLPMANYPAAAAGMRTSPLDDGNLNRSFPGTALGGPTQMLAHYIESELMPGQDVMIDIHSGGSSLRYAMAGFTALREADPQATLKQTVMDALQVDHALMYEAEVEGWYSSAAAHRAGAIGVTLEVGGGGEVSYALRQRLQASLTRLLAALGHVSEVTAPDSSHTAQRFSQSDLVFAMDTGLWESRVEVGASIVEGDLIATIHDPATPGADSIPVMAPRDAVILATRVGGRVERGDCLFHIGFG